MRLEARAAAGTLRRGVAAHGLPRRAPRPQEEAEGAAGGGPAVRHVDGVRDARRPGTASRPRASRRSSSSRWRPATSRRSSPRWRRSCAAPARRPARRSRRARTRTATAGSILRDPDVEDLVVGINAVSDALEVGGYGDRVLAAVFAFKDAKGQRRLLHLQLQARLLVPVRAGAGPAGARQRARAADQGEDRRRAADRARARALVPALGHPDLVVPWSWSASSPPPARVRSRKPRTFARLPQTRMSHQTAERLRDAS